MVDLMKHEQYIIQSDAQKTFDAIFRGHRLQKSMDRKDNFISWIEKNEDTDDGTDTFTRLNKMFKQMRESSNYSFKRHIMILQYEVLALGFEQELKRNQDDVDAPRDEGRDNQNSFLDHSGNNL
jgi:hypothetical protein